jgi:hypothetical protein
LERVTYSSGEGVYYFNQVIPSTYYVAAEAVGFKKFKQKNPLLAQVTAEDDEEPIVYEKLPKPGVLLPDE